MNLLQKMMIASAAASLVWTGASAKTLTEADAKSVATVQVGEPIEIKLQSDTTSPEQWIWTGDVNFNVLEADGMTTEPSAAPNEEFRVYKFKAIGKGNSAIMFFLRRGGEGPDEGVEPLIYEVHVQ